MEIIGVLAGFLTLVAYLPQTIKTIKTRHTKDLSLVTFLLIAVSALLWTVYGLAKQSPSIWITNAVVTFCSGSIVFIKITKKE